MEEKDQIFDQFDQHIAELCKTCEEMYKLFSSDILNIVSVKGELFSFMEQIGDTVAAARVVIDLFKLNSASIGNNTEGEEIEEIDDNTYQDLGTDSDISRMSQELMYESKEEETEVDDEKITVENTEDETNNSEWPDIIPMAMMDGHNGAEMFSNPKAAFNSTVIREPTQMKKTKASYSRKTMICLECSKKYVDANALKNHMAATHSVTDYQIVEGNRLPVDIVESQGKKSGVRQKLGMKTKNTRCFKCNKSFQHRLGYKNHVRKRHGGVEPPENLDPNNLAKPDDRTHCLICQKKFTNVMGLKLHINRIHLGVQEDGVDQGDDDVGEGGSQSEVKQPKQITQEDRRLIEKMFNRMRRYGCRFCHVRFNNKIKLSNHEAMHKKSTKTVPVAQTAEDKPVKCQLCPMSYNDKKGLYQHMFRKHPDHSKNPLDKTVALSPPESDLSDDVSNIAPIKMADGTFKCPLCPKTYNSQGGFSLHKKNHHSNQQAKTSNADTEDKEKKKNFICKICEKHYSSYASLYIHRKTQHPQEYPKVQKPDQILPQQSS